MKPLRPFPLPIRVGTDICQISRIFGIVAGGRGARFVDRILTPGERERAQARLQHISGPSARHRREGGGEDGLKKKEAAAGGSFAERAKQEPELWSLAAFLAGRFAAKEAAIKAHPHRHLTFHDVTIERMRPAEAMGDVAGVAKRLGSGPPIVRIAAGEGEEEDASALLSISHDGDYATAVCIGAQEAKAQAS